MAHGLCSGQTRRIRPDFVAKNLEFFETRTISIYRLENTQYGITYRGIMPGCDDMGFYGLITGGYAITTCMVPIT